MVFFTQIKTKPDVNGNSRRGWIVSDSDHPEETLFIFDHGQGMESLRRVGYLITPGDEKNYKFVATIEVAPMQFRRLAHADFGPGY